MLFINLLFALMISSAVVLGVAQGFLLVKKTFMAQRKQMNEWDLGRISFQYFLKDLSSAGYTGCRSKDPSFPLNHLYNTTNQRHRYLRFDRPVFGFLASPGACYGKLPEITCKRIKKNSPVLIIYNVPKKITLLTHPLTRLEAPLQVPSMHEIQRNSLVLISNGYRGDLFIANRVEESKIYHELTFPINDYGKLSYLYDDQSEVMELQTIAYYLAVPERFHKTTQTQKTQTSHPSSNTQTEFALFRDDLLQQAQEIVPDVSDLIFEFCIKLPGKETLQYRSLTEMDESLWCCVQSVRIGVCDQHQKRWNYEITQRNRVCP